jgi:conjugative relaxase-like TrwC/TraI family protein
MSVGGLRELVSGGGSFVRDPVAAQEVAERRICFFAQISAPKDVSIACLVGGDRRIASWWKEAVAETLREIEAVAATRVRKGGGADTPGLIGGRLIGRDIP